MDELLQQCQVLQQRVETLEAENKYWRGKVDVLLKRIYGSSSEQIPKTQLDMFMSGQEAPAAPAVVASLPTLSTPNSQPRKVAIRRGLPEHLETVEVVLEPEPVKQAPEKWKRIGEEITEELDYVPARFIRRLFIRPKYVPVKAAAAAQRQASDLVRDVLAEIQQDRPIIAALPPRLIDKGYPGPGLMAQVVISKYEDHLPLYRQEKIYRQRHGVNLSRQVLAEWVGHAAFWLKPIYETMKKALLAGRYLQADETPIRYLDPDQPGKAQLGYLWVYSAPGSDVLFDWHTTRAKTAAAEFLSGFRGELQTDAYPVYLSYAKDRPGEIQLVGCWAHCRRNFVEALKEDRRVAWVIHQIAHLYGIEKKLRAGRAGPALRQSVRAAEAQPVLSRLQRALSLLQPKVLPKSGFGQAIAYALEQWPSLIRYVANGRLEIDNNLIENAIRPSAIGKKNFLFIGHPKAGWHSAVIYSLLGSCRRHGINPYDYLSDVLTRLPGATNHQIEQLTPSAWAKAKKHPALLPLR